MHRIVLEDYSDSGRTTSDLWKRRHAEVDARRTCGRHLVELVELLAGSGKADLETVSFAEPSLVPGFGDAGNQVVANLDEAATLGQIRPQQRAAHTGVFVDARRGVGTTARAECDLASFEVAEEFLPLLFGGHAVFGAGAQRSPAGDEGAVAIDHLFGIDGLVSHGRVDIAMTGHELGDVWGHAVHDHVGDEHPAEVVRGEPQRPSRGVLDASTLERPADPPAYRVGRDRSMFDAEAALEQERHRRIPEALVRVVGRDAGDGTIVVSDPSNGRGENVGQLGADDQQPLGYRSWRARSATTAPSRRCRELCIG